jgi:hypothetical protein
MSNSNASSKAMNSPRSDNTQNPHLTKNEVKMGIAWICLGCGKVFTNKSLADIHKCTREITYINYDNV